MAFDVDISSCSGRCWGRLQFRFLLVQVQGLEFRCWWSLVIFDTACNRGRRLKPDMEFEDERDSNTWFCACLFVYLSSLTHFQHWPIRSYRDGIPAYLISGVFLFLFVYICMIWVTLQRWRDWCRAMEAVKTMMFVFEFRVVACCDVYYASSLYLFKCER